MPDFSFIVISFSGQDYVVCPYPELLKEYYDLVRFPRSVVPGMEINYG